MADDDELGRPGDIERFGIQPGDLYLENDDGTETQLGRPSPEAQQLANEMARKCGVRLPYPRAAETDTDTALDAAIDRFFAGDESDHWRTQPRDKGKFAKSGGAAATEFKPGRAARGAEAGSAMLRWVDQSPLSGASVEDGLRAAHETQDRLVTRGRKIAGAIRTLKSKPGGGYAWEEEQNPEGDPGIVFLNPGAKSDVDRIRKKLNKYPGYEGNIARLTDLARGAFLIDDPEKVEEITQHLGAEFSIAEEDWRRTDDGYFDLAAMLRDRNGIVAEVQIMPHQMNDAKNLGKLPDGTSTTPGHDLYVESRQDDTPAERKAELIRQMRRLYNTVLRNLGGKWRKTMEAMGVGEGVFAGADRAIAEDSWRSPWQGSWRSPWQSPRRPWEAPGH